MSSALASLIAELGDHPDTHHPDTHGPDIHGPEAGIVVTDPDIVASYRHDRAMDPSAGTPLAVVRPTTTAQVQTVLRWASGHRIPVVPRGAGSGLSGGATAVDGGIVLST